MNHEIILALFAFLLLPGVALSIFPGMPGLLYMFFVTVIYGFVDSFTHLTTNNLIALGIILVVSVVVDIVAGLIGAKHGGANKKSLLIGLAGMIVGTFIIPIPIIGSFIGFFLGIFIGEHIQKRSNKRAIKAATAGVVGAMAGSIINVIISIAFVVTFIFLALN